MAKNTDLQFDFDAFGKTFLAGHLHRLRTLISAQSDAVFEQFDIVFPSHCASLMLLIEEHKCAPVMAIAESLGYSHQLINQRISILEKAGCLQKSRDPNDRRKSIISLTRRGRLQAKKVREALSAIDAGIKSLCTEISIDLLLTMKEARQLLLSRPLLARSGLPKTTKKA